MAFFFLSEFSLILKCFLPDSALTVQLGFLFTYKHLIMGFGSSSTINYVHRKNFVKCVLSKV